MDTRTWVEMLMTLCSGTTGVSEEKKTGLENVTGPEKSFHSECQMAPASKTQARCENKA